jgi:hypothetical protein
MCRYLAYIITVEKHLFHLTTNFFPYAMLKKKEKSSHTFREFRYAMSLQVRYYVITTLRKEDSENNESVEIRRPF